MRVWLAAFLCLGLVAGGGAIALAGAGSGGLDESASGGNSRNSGGVTDATTQRVVNRINRIRSECGSLPEAYRADCASVGYEEAAELAQGPGYARAKTQLDRASRSLSKEVVRNLDADAPTINRGGKSYNAVKQSAVQKVNRKAVKIIAETETKLLRSSGSGERKVHYQRIAQAVGSTKVIFRS